MAVATQPDFAITKAGSGLPSRVIVHGVEGVGKSTIGAFAPKPVFGMTRGETGLLTLIDTGAVPPTDHFPKDFQSWVELKNAVNYLIIQPTGHKTFVLDTLNGAERLCLEHVCQVKYGGSWESFLAYGRGIESALQEWIDFLSVLDRLREAQRMAIILLCHTKVKTFKNPEGDDYDRYTPDMHDKTWGITHKWADIVLFANFETFAQKDKQATRAKAVSAGNRLLYTQRRAAWDAKNRCNLPPEIPMGTEPHQGWTNLFEALKAGRKNGQKGGEE